jgi:hypothetical protein
LNPKHSSGQEALATLCSPQLLRSNAALCSLASKAPITQSSGSFANVYTSLCKP